MTKRAWWITAWVSLALFLFIFSGAAWSLFRPVLHKPIIDRLAKQYKMDPLWLMAIIKVESGFQAGAKSNRGAIGLMQIMPATAADLAPQLGVPAPDADALKDPETNLRFGIYYVSKLAALFPGDELAALSAYNAGPGITKEWRGSKPALQWADIEYAETRRFVRRVERTYGWLKMMQGWKQILASYGS